VVATSAALTCGHPGPSREASGWWGRVDEAEAPLEEAIRRFDESDSSGATSAALSAARGAADAARRARASVERMTPPPELAPGHREELLFLNHVIPAFDRFADSGGGPEAREELRSILRRGRAHQRRARGLER
jgi:hypothetical protein